MKAVVLAGGEGKRFHPYSLVVPKPLIPIGEDPIILHLIRQFKKSGIKDFFLSVGYRSELIRAYLADGQQYGVNISYYKEEKPLGTAGPLTLMKKSFEKDEYFILINGDIYTEVDFSKMISKAQSLNSDVMVGSVQMTDKSSYGEIISEDGATVKKIIEKPERKFTVSAGIYVLNERVIQNIPEDSFYTVPQLIESYLKESRPVHIYDIKDYWMGIEDQEKMYEVTKRIT